MFYGKGIGHLDLERGQGLVEYALLLILVAMVLLVLLVIFGEEVVGFFEFIYDQLPFKP